MRSLLLLLIVMCFSGASIAEGTATLNASSSQQSAASTTTSSHANSTSSTTAQSSTAAEPSTNTTPYSAIEPGIANQPSVTQEPSVSTTPTSKSSISSEPYTSIQPRVTTLPETKNELLQAKDTAPAAEPSPLTESTIAMDPGVLTGDDVSNLCPKFLKSNRWYSSDDTCMISGRNVIKGSAINPYRKKVRLSDGRIIKASTFRCTENGIEIFIQWGRNNDASYALGFIAPEYGGENTLVLNLVSAGRLQKECVGSYAYTAK